MWYCKQGFGMIAAQIDLARWNEKVPMNEIHQAVRQIAREVGPVVSGPILDQPPRYIDARKSFAGQFDVRIGLVVAQQDVETRLVLLDEVVFERERFLLVIDENVVDVARFAMSEPVLTSDSLSSLK